MAGAQRQEATVSIAFGLGLVHRWPVSARRCGMGLEPGETARAPLVAMDLAAMDQVAATAVLFHRAGGSEAAVEAVRRRAGTSLDPGLGEPMLRRLAGSSACSTSPIRYFAVSDVAEALERVEALGGSVVHPGEAWAICKDSEGSPFGLAQESLGA